MDLDLKKLIGTFRKYYSITGDFYKRYKKEYLISSVLVVLSSIFLFPVPIFTKRLIDVVYKSGSPQDIIELLIIIVVILLFSKILFYFGNLMFFKLSSKIILLLRSRMLEQILKSRFDLFSKYDTGYLLGRINEDPAYLNTIFGQQIVDLIQNVVIVLVSIIGLIFLSPKLSLFILVIIPVLIWTFLFFSRRMKSIFPVFLDKRAHEISTLQESLRFFEFLKSSLREIVGIRRYFSGALKTHKVNVGYGKYHFGSLSVSTFLTDLTPVLIFGIGGLWVLSGSMTLSTLIAFNMFMAYLFSSTKVLLNLNITLQVAISALDRIHEILEYPEETYVIFSTKINSLELKDVSFAYNENPILRKVNLTAKSGEKIGITGESGEGKTTILKIIAGILYNFEGKYLVNDSQLSLQEIIGLRKKMALVHQEPLLFKDSVLYNLKVLNPLVKDEEIFEIMEKLRMHDFILSLPKGYNTFLDLKTIDLSAGQKQRIAFARAYLKHPDILLLDEITSNLDEEGEEALLSVINEITEMIVIIVSHRPKPLELCDRIYLVKNGETVEFNTKKLKDHS